MMKLLCSAAAFLLVTVTVSALLVAAVDPAAPLHPPVDAFVSYDSSTATWKTSTSPLDYLCRIQANFTVNTTGWNEMVLTANFEKIKSDPVNVYIACGYAEGYYFAELFAAALINSGFRLDSFPESRVKPTVDPLTKEELVRNQMFDLYTNMAQYGAGSEDTITSQSTKRFIGYIQGLTHGANAKLGTAISPVLALTYSLQAELPDYANAAFFNAGIKQPAPGSITRPTTPTLPPSKADKSASRSANVASAASINNNNNNVFVGADDHDEPEYLRIARAEKLLGHCSALVRLTDDDLFMAHDTWSGYGSMGDRTFKVYNFENSVALSSWVGSLSSIDDFYATNSLICLETTLVQENTALSNLVTTQTVPTAFRIMAAMIWGTTPEMASKIVGFKSSGTYCNTWIFLSRKITAEQIKTKTLPAGSIWINEQLPGDVSPSADVTADLVKYGYVAGDNVAYFEQTYALSNELLQASQGSIFTGPVGPTAKNGLVPGNYSRQMIFFRDAPKIQNLAAMKAMMRYNNWTEDEASKIPNCPSCNPRNNAQLTIANRADLVPAESNFAELYKNEFGINNPAFLSKSAFGAVDSKLYAWSDQAGLSSAVKLHVVSGPSTSGGTLTPFSWSVWNATNANVTIPVGAKTDAWTFDWINPGKNGVVELPNQSVAPWPITPSNAHKLSAGAIVGIVIGICIAFVVVLFACRAWKRKGGGTGIAGGVQEAHQVSNPGAYNQV